MVDVIPLIEKLTEIRVRSIKMDEKLMDSPELQKALRDLEMAKRFYDDMTEIHQKWQKNDRILRFLMLLATVINVIFATLSLFRIWEHL